MHDALLADMATKQDLRDPFCIRGLLTLPALDGDILTTWHLSTFEKSLESTAFALDIPQGEKLQSFDTELFSLNLDDVPLPDLDSITESAVASDAENDDAQSHVVAPELEKEEDIWALPEVVYRPHVVGLLSWDSFFDSNHNEPAPIYLSEAKIGAFGQALHLSSNAGDTGDLKNAKYDVLESSLWELSCGRESVFFSYDSTKLEFARRFDGYTIPDVSQKVIDSIVCDFQGLGNDVRALRVFTEQKSGSHRERIRQGMSAAVGIAMYALESSIESSRAVTTSLLQLQKAIEKPRSLAASLRILTEHCPKDTDNIAPLVRACDDLGGKYPWLRECLQEVVARGVSSQLEGIGQSVGLGTSAIIPHMPLSKSTLSTDSTTESLAPEVREGLIESQQGLSLLKNDSPDHPLLTHPATSSIKLQLEYSWEAISELQTKATDYEDSLKQALLVLQTPTEAPPETMREFQPQTTYFPIDVQSTSSTSQTLVGMDVVGPATQTMLGNEVAAYCDTLYQTTISALSRTDLPTADLQPDPDQSMSLSLMPLLKSQHRLLSYSILFLLLESHHLRDHLTIQNRFQLMSDGLFASRLSNALFDSTEASGEGRRRAAGRTGLRLQSRDTWPPASSELRLVLMGILSESISTKDGQRGDSKVAVRASHSHLESISFAIRDLTNEDLEKCRDADTIHALDFLALQYTPPTPLLEAVITSRSLKVYADIFQHLLRLLRVRSAAQDLVRDVSRRSNTMSNIIPGDHAQRVAVHHFVSTLADWVQNAVIVPKWASFAMTISRVESCFKNMDYDGVLQAGKGLGFIRSLHEGVVDDIARTLFLKRKYMEVKAVLDDSFNTVLQLAKHIRMGQNSRGEIANDATLRQLYESFRKQVKSFLTYLRANSGGTQDERDSRGPEALMDQLALRLDMFGYYAEKT